MADLIYGIDNMVLVLTSSIVLFLLGLLIYFIKFYRPPSSNQERPQPPPRINAEQYFLDFYIILVAQFVSRLLLGR